MLYKKVALIGLGLIASSICLSLKRAKVTVEVIGTSRSLKTRSKAAELGLCEVLETPVETVKGADLVVLCVPVGAMRDIVKEILPNLKPGSTLTDVGSVKGGVIESIHSLLPVGVNFIPGHPLAGTEHSGPEAGFESLFDNRWCLLTPLAGTPDEPRKKLKYFWEILGAKVDFMSPQHHDLVLAVTSHVPHLIAYTMVGVADDLSKVTKSEVIDYSAAGFRDFTRIAASDPTMWRDVFLHNKEASLEILERFTEELLKLKTAVSLGNGELLFNYFSRTREVRRSIVAAGQDTSEANFGRKTS